MEETNKIEPEVKSPELEGALEEIAKLKETIAQNTKAIDDLKKENFKLALQVDGKEPTDGELFADFNKYKEVKNGH